jgi:hypothetical protein
VKRSIPFLLWFAAALRLALPSPQSVHPPLIGDDIDLTAPFSNGETLVFEVNWKPLFFVPAFKAGEIRLRVEDSSYNGRETYKIRAWAVSDGALARIAGMVVQNYYESEIDRRSFHSYRSFQRIRQGQRQRDMELLLDYERDRITYRETDPSTNPPRLLRSTNKTGLPSGATDIVSVFYVARLRVLPVGRTFSLHLTSRGDFEEIRVTAEGEERVSTPAGRFNSVKVTTIGGLFQEGGDLRVWVSRDDLRIPIRFESTVNFGRVYGRLIRLESPQLHRGLIRISEATVP